MALGGPMGIPMGMSMSKLDQQAETHCRDTINDQSKTGETGERILGKTEWT
jgi:hypothetical protein